MSMMSSTHAEPFEAQPTNESQRNLTFRLGHSLGQFFVATKNKARNKYKEVTSGINQSLEEEEARRFFEVQMALDAQAQEYEEEMQQMKKQWIKKSILFSFIFLLLGGAAAIGILYLYVMP